MGGSILFDLACPSQTRFYKLAFLKLLCTLSIDFHINKKSSDSEATSREEYEDSAPEKIYGAICACCQR